MQVSLVTVASITEMKIYNVLYDLVYPKHLMLNAQLKGDESLNI